MSDSRITVYKYETSILNEPFTIKITPVIVEDDGDYYNELYFDKNTVSAIPFKKDLLEKVHRHFYSYSYKSLYPDRAENFKQEIVNMFEESKRELAQKIYACDERISGIKRAQVHISLM